jgi:hypothetical protein
MAPHGVAWSAPPAGAHLPPSQASLRTAPRGVAATGTPCRCVPPTIVARPVMALGVWRRPAPPAGAHLPPSWTSPGTAPRGVTAAGTPAGARLPPSRASLGMAPRGVAVGSTLLRPGADVCRCTPPTVMGESGNGSARCGGSRQPLLRLVCASLRRKRVNGSTVKGSG